MKNQIDPVLFAKAMADPTRQEIMKMTCCNWMNVGEIVARMNVSQPTVSHHLAILRDAGLVLTRTEGKHTFYSLNQDHLAVCCGQLISTFAPETESAEILQEIQHS